LRVICGFIENGCARRMQTHPSNLTHYELLGEEYRNVTDITFNVVDRRLQIFNKREVCAIFVLLPVTGNGCVFIRINNRGCGVGGIFQRRKTEDGPIRSNIR
ncbi:hypothetical protein NXV71_02860, partial [Bacteroides fragilis]|nr:hypothetical protein [Bacteroides fragilis]